MWILWKMRFWKCEFLDKLRIFAQMWNFPIFKRNLQYCSWACWPLFPAKKIPNEMAKMREIECIFVMRLQSFYWLQFDLWAQFYDHQITLLLRVTMVFGFPKGHPKNLRFGDPAFGDVDLDLQWPFSKLNHVKARLHFGNSKTNYVLPHFRFHVLNWTQNHGIKCCFLGIRSFLSGSNRFRTDCENQDSWTKSKSGKFLFSDFSAIYRTVRITRSN